MSAAAVRLGFIAPQGDASVRQHLSLGRATMLKRRGMPWEYLLYVTLAVDSCVFSKEAPWCLLGLSARRSAREAESTASGCIGNTLTLCKSNLFTR